MSFSANIGIILLVFSVLISLILIVYLVIKGKKTRIFYSFIWCQLLLLNWSLGMIFELYAVKESIKWTIICVEYFSISFIGVSWILFSLYYTESKFPKRLVRILPLFIPPIVCYIMLLTNNYHYLFYREFGISTKVYGVFFWANVLQAHSYIIIANIRIIVYSLKQPNYRKEQAILVTLVSLIPAISNVMYVTKLINLNFDSTPVSFSISMILLTVAVFRFRFLDIVSSALLKVFDNMNDAIIIINSFNKIIDFNKSFKRLFEMNCKLSVNDDIDKFSLCLMQRLESCNINLLNSIVSGTDCSLEGELVLKGNEFEYFSVSVQPLFNKRRNMLGRVIIFSNVSTYKKLMDKLDYKNKELLLINEQLKEYLAAAEDLARERERNRIAQEVHDTLGHTMTMLIALLEVCKITYNKDTLMTEQKLSEAIDAARGGLKELRQSLYQIKSEELRSEDCISKLQSLIEGFELTGIKIELVAEGVEGKLQPIQSEVIYKICREALTNSLRHGKAQHISIILKLVESRVKLFILDDGCGCSNINKGLGLAGMEKRVEEINGSIVYGSDGEKGFNIHVEIPIGGVYR